MDGDTERAARDDGRAVAVALVTMTLLACQAPVWAQRAAAAAPSTAGGLAFVSNEGSQE